MVLLVGLSVRSQPSLAWSLLYPTDTYGQHCGRAGTPVAHLPKLMYPDLDGDFKKQAVFLGTAPYWEYWRLSLTGLCVESCPQGISLRESIVYGGPEYPVGPEAGSGEPSSGERVGFRYTFQGMVKVAHFVLKRSEREPSGTL